MRFSHRKTRNDIFTIEYSTLKKSLGLWKTRIKYATLAQSSAVGNDAAQKRELAVPFCQYIQVVPCYAWSELRPPGRPMRSPAPVEGKKPDSTLNIAQKTGFSNGEHAPSHVPKNIKKTERSRACSRLVDSVHHHGSHAVQLLTAMCKT